MKDMHGQERRMRKEQREQYKTHTQSQKNVAREETRETFMARGETDKYLFVHKVSLHSNEMLHNQFSKQAQPHCTQGELLEWDVSPAFLGAASLAQA